MRCAAVDAILRQARRAEAAALAAERHQPRLLTPIAPEPHEAKAQQAAIQIALELLIHEPRKRDREGAFVHSTVERGQVVLHYLMERRLLRSSTLVDDAAWPGHVAPTASPRPRRCNLAPLRSAPPGPDTFAPAPGAPATSSTEWSAR